MAVDKKQWEQARRVSFECCKVFGLYDHDAEDVSQEALLKIAQNRHTFDPNISRWTTWCWAIARNTALGFHRKRKRVSETSWDTLLPTTVEEVLLERFEALHGDDTRSRAALRKCLDELDREAPDGHALVFDRYFSDETNDVKRMAKERDTTESNIYTMLTRVRKVLRNCILKRLRK